jgi:3-deoxy-D-manno-octulosonic-acid transferase
MMNHPLLAYRAVLWLASPLWLVYTLWRAARDGGTTYLRQRLGLDTPQLDAPLWAHCASVGEVNTMLPLLKALAHDHPQVPLLITTNTPTGREVLRKQMGDRVTHSFLPLDFGVCVKRFLETARPRCAIMVETELWPNLYEQCAARGMSLIMVNARLSARTLGAPAAIRGAYRHALAQVSAVLARSELDAVKFRQLGAPSERVQSLGSLKFARPFEGDIGPQENLIGRPYWLAASTHDDEELRIARIWQRLYDTGQVLVIAPRHPERRIAILRQLRPLGMEISVRSRNEPITPTTRIYLADTLGELITLMAHARLVFMGGSMVPRGGHNMLEPARLGRAVLIGPHVDNFEFETRSLLAAEAIMMARDDRELGFALERLLNDAELRATLGRRAAAFMAARADIGQIYLKRLEALCGLDAPHSNISGATSLR